MIFNSFCAHYSEKEVPCPRREDDRRKSLWRWLKVCSPLIYWLGRCCNQRFPSPVYPVRSSSPTGRLWYNIFLNIYNHLAKEFDRFDSCLHLLIAWSKFMLLLLRGSSAGSLCKRKRTYTHLLKHNIVKTNLETAVYYAFFSTII